MLDPSPRIVAIDPATVRIPPAATCQAVQRPDRPATRSPLAARASPVSA